MKNYFLLPVLLFSIIFQSCETYELENSEEPVALAKFKESNDFKSLQKNFPKFASNLNISTFTENVEKGILYYNIKAINNNRNLGIITFFSNKIGDYYTTIEAYRYDENDEINKIEFKNIHNELLFSYNAEKFDSENYYITFDNKSLSNMYYARSWLSCTVDCVGDAGSICFGDNDCGWVCGILGGACFDSFLTSCGIWCAIDTDNNMIQ